MSKKITTAVNEILMHISIKIDYWKDKEESCYTVQERTIVNSWKVSATSLFENQVSSIKIVRS